MKAQQQEHTGVWEPQFDPAFDYPATIIETKYVICTSPRCGSHFLGHLLHQAGGFGYPLEYVNRANLQVWTARARAAAPMRPLEYVKSIRTDRNGVFGIKVHFNQLSTFLEHEPRFLEYKFITLERRDLVKQAVSYAWAAQTNSWISGMPASGTARYDWQYISGKLNEITKSNAGWRGFLAKLGITALELTFEDVRDNPDEALRVISQFLDVRRDGAATVRAFTPVEQVEAGKHEWVKRFIGESRDRLGRGQLPPNEVAPRRRRWVDVFRRDRHT
jgi:trehalose 2-sulfotransferase